MGPERLVDVRLTLGVASTVSLHKTPMRTAGVHSMGCSTELRSESELRLCLPKERHNVVDLVGN